MTEVLKYLHPPQAKYLRDAWVAAGRGLQSVEWVPAWYLRNVPSQRWVFREDDTTYADASRGCALKMHGTHFYFALAPNFGSNAEFMLGLCPGIGGQYLSSPGAKDFEVVKDAFGHWLGLLKETDIPDPWAMAAADIAGQIESEGDERPFAAHELDALRRNLDQLKDFIQQQSELTREQVQKLQQDIDYLKRAAERSTKLDWRNIAASHVSSPVKQTLH